MADYYPILAQAVAALRENSADARADLYARARTAVARKLRGMTPPLRATDIARENSSLEEAIRRAELGAARRSLVRTLTSTFGQKDRAQLVDLLRSGDIGTATQLGRHLPGALLIASWDQEPILRANAGVVIASSADLSLRRARSAANELRSFPVDWQAQGTVATTLVNFMVPRMGDVGALTFRASLAAKDGLCLGETSAQCAPLLHDRLVNTSASVVEAKDWLLDAWCAYACVLDYIRLTGGLKAVDQMALVMLATMRGTDPPDDVMGLALLVGSIDKPTSRPSPA